MEISPHEMKQKTQTTVYDVLILQVQRAKQNPRLGDRDSRRGSFKEPEDEEDEEIPSDIASSGEEAEAFHGVSKVQESDISERKVVSEGYKTQFERKWVF